MRRRGFCWGLGLCGRGLRDYGGRGQAESCGYEAECAENADIDGLKVDVAAAGDLQACVVEPGGLDAEGLKAGVAAVADLREKGSQRHNSRLLHVMIVRLSYNKMKGILRKVE